MAVMRRMLRRTVRRADTEDGELVIGEHTTADEWLEDLDRAGRAILHVPSGIEMLDDMEQRRVLPSLGWVQRETYSVTDVH